jgi:hypothetical protein
MLKRASESPDLGFRFARSAIPLGMMILSWSFGEWLGYWTERRPGKLTVAPEID